MQVARRKNMRFVRGHSGSTFLKQGQGRSPPIANKGHPERTHGVGPTLAQNMKDNRGTRRSALDNNAKCCGARPSTQVSASSGLLQNAHAPEHLHHAGVQCTSAADAARQAACKQAGSCCTSKTVRLHWNCKKMRLLKTSGYENHFSRHVRPRRRGRPGIHVITLNLGGENEYV